MWMVDSASVSATNLLFHERRCLALLWKVYHRNSAVVWNRQQREKLHGKSSLLAMQIALWPSESHSVRRAGLKRKLHLTPFIVPDQGQSVRLSYLSSSRTPDKHHVLLYSMR